MSEQPPHDPPPGQYPPPPGPYPPPPGGAMPPYPGQPYPGQPYPGGPGWSGPPAHGWGPAPARNGLTTAGLVLGIVGIFPLAGFFVPNVLAIVFGFVGRARARRGESSNGAMATVAIVLGVVGLAVSALVIVYVVHKIQHDCARDVDGVYRCRNTS